MKDGDDNHIGWRLSEVHAIRECGNYSPTKPECLGKQAWILRNASEDIVEFRQEPLSELRYRTLIPVLGISDLILRFRR